MSTPVITNKWAGNFDCPGPCIRKRLAGGDFSKKAMERYHKTGLLSNCKNCTAAIAVKERLVGEREKYNNNNLSNNLSNNNNNSEDAEKRKCTKCEKTLPKSLYNRSQWKKGEGLARCRPCVESAIINEADTTQTTLKNKMALVHLKIVEAEKRGNVLARVQAESELSALEVRRCTIHILNITLIPIHFTIWNRLLYFTSSFVYPFFFLLFVQI